MSRRILFAAAVVAVGASLAVPGLAGAQTPGQDSVRLTGGPAIANLFVVIDLNATSGPSGENPTGQVRFDVPALPVSVGGPVTCLAVSGNTAIINVQDQINPLPDVVTVEVVDDEPDTFDANTVFGRAPTDCSPLPSPSPGGGPLSSGNITVTDAPPLPTSQEQCKDGGWHTYGVFENQGDCVSFVATGGKNPPGTKTG